MRPLIHTDNYSSIKSIDIYNIWFPQTWVQVFIYTLDRIIASYMLHMCAHITVNRNIPTYLSVFPYSTRIVDRAQPIKSMWTSLCFQLELVFLPRVRNAEQLRYFALINSSVQWLQPEGDKATEPLGEAFVGDWPSSPWKPAQPRLNVNRIIMDQRVKRRIYMWREYMWASNNPAFNQED